MCPLHGTSFFNSLLVRKISTHDMFPPKKISTHEVLPPQKSGCVFLKHKEEYSAKDL